MKHEKTIKRILAELHKPWMDESDKEQFDAEMIRQFGKQLDADIETGIANGYTAEQQAAAVLAMFRLMQV
jgi:hypothetical protein